MIGDRSFRRSLEWIGAGWRILTALKGGSEGGWPDKSAAVGVGGGDCNKTIISAVARHSLLALASIPAMFSTINAPSATERLKSATSDDE